MKKGIYLLVTYGLEMETSCRWFVRLCRFCASYRFPSNANLLGRVSNAMVKLVGRRSVLRNAGAH